MAQWLFKDVLFSFHAFMNFLVFLHLVSSFISIVTRKDTWNDFDLLKLLRIGFCELTCDLCWIMVYAVHWVDHCALEKNVYSAVVWKFCRSVRFIVFIVFPPDISVLIFWLFYPLKCDIDISHYCIAGNFSIRDVAYLLDVLLLNVYIFLLWLLI